MLVPGVPGYIPIRERHAMNWTRADGSENPDWWEVEGKKPLGDRSSFDQPGFPATRQYQHFELDFVSGVSLIVERSERSRNLPLIRLLSNLSLSFRPPTAITPLNSQYLDPNFPSSPIIWHIGLKACYPRHRGSVALSLNPWISLEGRAWKC